MANRMQYEFNILNIKFQIYRIHRILTLVKFNKLKLNTKINT